MLVLPTYVPLPDDGMVKSLLVKVAKRMKREGEAATEAGGGIIERAACESIKVILSREKVASREYFGRAWTLAERVARFGGGWRGSAAGSAFASGCHCLRGWAWSWTLS